MTNAWFRLNWEWRDDTEIRTCGGVGRRARRKRGGCADRDAPHRRGRQSDGELWQFPEDALPKALTNAPSRFTLATAGTAYFGYYDRPLTDNRGGVSFAIAEAPAIPLPASGFILVSAFSVLDALRARR